MSEAAGRDTPSPVAVWGFVSLVLILCAIPRIGPSRMYDPDDIMRLLEVRALLAGQSWWDVGQHGFAGPGLTMHWSRLVDLPLAAVVLALRGIVGDAAAERIAAIAVPLVTLGVVMALVAAITRRLAGRPAVLAAMVMVPLTTPLLSQLQPLRIDHHGWQIASGLLAAAALILRRDARSGIVAGLGGALLVTISFEGFAFLLALIAAAGLAWVFVPARAAQTRGFGVTMALATLLLHLVTRGPGWASPACDAIDPAWLATIGIAGIGLALATLAPLRSPVGRFALLAVTGAATVATMALLASECARGPFGMLDPLTYRVWFLNIAEGLPVWHQYWPTIAGSFTLPAVTVVMTPRRVLAAPGDRREPWTILLGLLIAATLCGLIVLRSAALANALAIPPVAAIVADRLARARAIVPPLRRLTALLGVAAIAAPGLVLTGILLLLGVPDRAVVSIPRPYLTGEKPVCPRQPDVAPLAALPAGATILAPLDIGPAIVASTGLRPIASGYHRNAPAMRFVIASFMARPDLSRSAILGRGVDYVVGCPGISENLAYANAAPHGLWARLERGERFDWLEPVAIPNSPILVWRVVRPLASPPA
ncbi:hypothetical protein [uncultured Sphingomonas sp.]|uniref:hypothetical protein n=1 Tax=uncultured Sphingomonas sp. TaxID=158754 RepID=UPI0025EF40B3|nr:hypothetical protein [uncultured Sphingomonas sp.]